jgi:hypothetical protein
VALLFVREKNFLWRRGHRHIPADALLHPTVLERFKLSGVLVHDTMGPYRPHALRQHWLVRGYWPRPGSGAAAGASGSATPSRRPTPRLHGRLPAPATPGRRWWKARYR